jgi:hypothetical protein
MGILTLYGTKNNIRKIPLHTWEYYLGMGQKKHKENSHMFSINSFAFMEYFLS